MRYTRIIVTHYGGPDWDPTSPPLGGNDSG